ncbi:MAG: type II toxin-antitoxin system VapC family toxin [Anaerolineales bacterium]|nr:type II toxin-antitoxin system VapC family toxin [Anaerolineales bacterium]
MPSLFVLDSYAVMVFLKRQPGEAEVAALFARAAKQEIALEMSAVNWGEVWYLLAREYGERIAEDKTSALMQIPLQVADVNWVMARQAAAFKAYGGISYADCFTAALAKLRNAPLVTGDPEFRRLEKEIEIRWLKRR